MQTDHWLVQRAFVYDRAVERMDPDDCKYDNSIGAWILRDQDEFLVRSRDTDRPTTKKMDQETGEDLKGS